MKFNPTVHMADENGDPVRTESGDIRLKTNWKDLAVDRMGRKFNVRVHGEKPLLGDDGMLSIRPRKEDRVIMSATQRLTAFVEMNSEKNDGYTYRVVNDEPGRIQKFLSAEWEQVATTDGIAEMNVGRALEGGTRAVLMRKPVEWYDEDQKLKRERTVKDLAAVSEPSQSGQYIPDGQESALRTEQLV